MRRSIVILASETEFVSDSAHICYATIAREFPGQRCRGIARSVAASKKGLNTEVAEAQAEEEKLPFGGGQTRILAPCKHAVISPGKMTTWCYREVTSDE